MHRILLVCGYYFFLLICVVAPVFLLLWALADAAGETKKLAKTYVFLFFDGGMSTALASFAEWGLKALLNPDSKTILGCFIKGFVVAAFTEETVKFAILVLVVVTSTQFVRYTRTLAFSAFVSLGFAFFENIDYVSLGPLNRSLYVAFTRAFTAIPGHCIFSIFMGYFLALAIFGKKKGVNILRAEGGLSGASEKRRKYFYKNVALSYGVAIVAHGVYDFLLILASEAPQFRRIALASWGVLFIAALYMSSFCVDVLKAKDQAVAEMKQAARKSDDDVNIRR